MDRRQRLEKSWTRTRRHFANALALVSTSQLETVAEFEKYREFLFHNELELAMEQLIELGNCMGVPVEFWVHLEQAAFEMKLKEQAEYCRAHSGRPAG